MRKYLAAVSGGPDSMYMLAKYVSQIKVVCHVNYHLREESNNDENIVKQYCSKYKIKFLCLNVTKKIYQKYQKLSNNKQTIYRLIRYDFFATIAKKYKLKEIIVAHTYNDHLESAYLQLEKKTRTLFLGIPKKSECNGLIIKRPIINISKKDIVDYCDNNSILYAIDKTNLIDLYRRNVVRKIINNWTKKERTLFINKINKYNINHRTINLTTLKTYKQWKLKSFNIKYFFNIEKTIKFHIIYLFLANNFGFIQINKPKINQLIAFIEKFNNEYKIFRLANNIFVKKQAGFLVKIQK